MIHDVEWGMAPYILWYDCVSIVKFDRLKVISGDFICNNLVRMCYESNFQVIYRITEICPYTFLGLNICVLLNS